MSTSSPAPTPSAASASSRATVPEATAAASAVPRRPASSRSRAATSGPWASCPERTTRATRSASSSVIDGREWGISAATPLLEQATLGPSRARGPRYNESKVQQQPNGLEGLGVLHARLDPTEVGGRDGQLEDRQVLDVGLGHLRAVRLQARELLVQHLLDVGEAVRREVDAGRPLVEQEVRDVPGGGERALGEVAVVLVRVLRKVDEDHARLDLADHGLEADDQLAVERDLGVLVVAPEHLAGADDQRRVLLLAAAHGAVAAQGAVGGHEQVDGVAFLRVLGEHPTAAELDVVGVGADGEDVHSGLLGPGVAATEDREALIAVHQ